jgi:hypothetical protein
VIKDVLIADPSVLWLNFKNVGEIDLVSDEYVKALSLTLARNHIASLRGMAQFQQLQTLCFLLQQVRCSLASGSATDIHTSNLM